MFLGVLESLPALPPPTNTLLAPGYNPGNFPVAPGHMAPATVSATSASSIMRLAAETLEEIVAFTPPESDLSLCRVSKLFYSLCVRSIYSDIGLKSPAAVVKCCRTVANNVNVASVVKSFEISYTPSRSPPFSAFYALIGSALQRMTNVHHLVLLVPDPSYIAVLKRCYLPHLNHFECCLPLEDTMVTFLNRHLQITYLQLGAHEVVPHPQHSIVTLPKLEYFIGNSSCVAPVIRRASLRAAFITWDPVGEPPLEDSIAALGRSSTETLNVLSCRRHGWNLDLLNRISTHLPHIYALSMTNLFFTDLLLIHDLANLQTIGDYLTRFSSLQRLTITCVNVWKPEDEPEPQMDRAFDTVTAWGTVCPSLVECMVPHSNAVKWVRVCDDLWLPSGSSSARWVWGQLRCGKYPGWDRVIEALRARNGGERTSGGGRESHHRRLEKLRSAALAHEYESDDEDAQRFGRITLGGAGSRVDDVDGEEGSC
ncbi:hypothetical protein B0H17DRAFT_1177688 [Mycena rosella]|uniref:F-box domain-containing protein n=1 Tax=Mycena rosella TaxID=1033263 RepID=A0AAD7DQ90_MYCRO|nr:hypothetical protein B0H17DRAFT_1177688 [Mycena rosella]